MALPISINELEVKTRLHELFGLEAEHFREVIMQGVFSRRMCTAHHPRTYPGLAQWAETVRSLRDITSPFGWSYSDDNNFPLCIHPKGNLVIAVQTGDIDTGMINSTPSNRAAKGTNTEQAVWANQKQLHLFSELSETINYGDERIMWVLLYHTSSNEIRYELSLPLNIIGGKIRSWQERLVFPAITLDQVDIEIGDDDGQEIEINIERKL